MHHEGIRLGQLEARAIEAPDASVFPEAREHGSRQPFLLDAQHHHHVRALDGRFDAIEDRAAERLDALRQEGPGACQAYFRT
jgi:hypothetical protein